MAADSLPPADCQRDVDARIVAVCLGVRERHSVVGSDNDNGILQHPTGLQYRQDRLKVGIEPFDFKCIVRQVCPDLVRVREV